jgi:superfamily II DNA/RNA helicase
LLARKLTAAGAPAVDLHGNLSQNIRAKNLAAFANGTAPTLVATDIAARGIHVDDVALVVHADPPVEHKAYLHRSGRTARAGNAGTVVTLMTDAQKRDVRDLTRKAGVQATVTKLDSGHPLLAEIAPGDRVLVTPSPVSERSHSDGGARGGSRRRHSGGKGRSGGGQATRRYGESRREDGRGSDSRGGSGHRSRPSRGQSNAQGGGQSAGRGAGGQTGSGPSNSRRKPRHTQAKRRTNQRPTPSR